MGQLHRDDENQPASLEEYYEDGTIKAKEWGEWDRELLDCLPPNDEDLPHREEYYKNGQILAKIWEACGFDYYREEYYKNGSVKLKEQSYNGVVTKEAS